MQIAEVLAGCHGRPIPVFTPVSPLSLPCLSPVDWPKLAPRSQVQPLGSIFHLICRLAAGKAGQVFTRKLPRALTLFPTRCSFHSRKMHTKTLALPGMDAGCKCDAPPPHDPGNRIRSARYTTEYRHDK